MKKLTTLRFECQDENSTDAYYVPINGMRARAYELRPCTTGTVDYFRLFSLGGEAVRATHVLLPDPSGEDGYRAEPLNQDRYGAYVPKEPLWVDPSVRLRVLVKNDSVILRRATLVAVGMAKIKVSLSDGVKEFSETALYAMTPRPTQSHRLCIAPLSSLDVTLQPPFECRILLVTMRSDSQGDVEVSHWQSSNVQHNLGENVPVELFAGGLEVRSPVLTAANRTSMQFLNTSKEPRWVEVDLGVEPTAALGQD